MNARWRAAWTRVHEAEELEQCSSESGELVDRALISSIHEDVLWSALSAFVALRLDSFAHTLETASHMDYKREDEVVQRTCSL